jgi:hypothetical protein
MFRGALFPEKKALFGYSGLLAREGMETYKLGSAGLNHF